MTVHRPLFLPGSPAPAEQRRGLLLCDRDGTVIENRSDYVLSPADIVLLPGAVAALRAAAGHGLALVFVSNQSPVGRGLLTEADCLRIQRTLVDRLEAEGVPVAGSYLCPHAPESGCGCRKPAPGMLRLAQRRFGAAPEQCALIGDSVEDMDAAAGAGARPVLVRTGRGAEHEPRVRARADLGHVAVVADLGAAVESLIGDGTRFGRRSA
ncbi:D-glycero-alpha-D-manno-heptose-1,7-bisphosphate 7-phosphatase [Kitasatospora azatica]|uniref:D-glycero-alpha-D-manno-heptose-1,7-bisphosphate 7-phosphatase n=1 Tax=Kitasatospora azatica TaxID=58347 RepID=UPI00068AB986|nr:HAD-IIIA family hydrolase [Kitasatospora azatica]